MKRQCNIAKFGVIAGPVVYYGFRCSTHNLADGRRFLHKENLQKAINEHKLSKQKKNKQL